MVSFNIVGTIFDKNYPGLRNMCLMVGNIPFGTWGVCGTIAYVMNKLRIKKIEKELGITAEQFNALADLYLG
jgi:hypothetical protein